MECCVKYLSIFADVAVVWALQIFCYLFNIIKPMSCEYGKCNDILFKLSVLPPDLFLRKIVMPVDCGRMRI